MTRYQITTRTTTEPADQGAPWGFRRLHLLANGQEISYHDFGGPVVTDAEWFAARTSLCNWLYRCPNFSQYHDALYALAFPYGE